MRTSIIDKSPLFEISADMNLLATPIQIYSIVSDLPRSAEWSPECMGGDWVSGEPAAVGTIFRGENLRSPDVVAWAPLIRGTWHTEARVTRAEPGRTFRWMMLTHASEEQDSIWGFDMAPAENGTGSVLVHHFRMGAATAGIRKIVTDLNEKERKDFIHDWTAKLQQDLDETLKCIKKIVEAQ